MFFHFEARYLLGTLPDYLPLVCYLLSRFRFLGPSKSFPGSFIKE